MNKIHILDCTLRDGGYCNQWNFGLENSKKIAEGLTEANIEIIELGFITNKITYSPDITKYTTTEEVADVIPKNRDGRLFVTMMNYGEYDVADLPYYDGTSFDGIRVAFHKKNLIESMEICRKIKAKGYLVFVQAMVSLNYTDEEFLDLIRMVNEIEPYAFYIVDSFGMMKEKDLIRLFYVVEHNLKESIWIGFHSHNNMQLAYSNAQRLMTLQTSRNLIIDSTIMGMGRGAGNLNTELFVEYLNENVGKNYNMKPLLNIIDKVLSKFYERNYWGYSLPNYISAAHNAHPSYAGYLESKKTLTYEDMDNIFNMMDEDKKVSFDKEYIRELYLRYQEKDCVQEERLSDFSSRIAEKSALIIAPGKSSVTEREKIVSMSKHEDVLVISINYDYDDSLTDFIFVSNLRRYRDLPNDKKKKCIVTSNIPADGVYLQVSYKELLNKTDAVQDNAGLMLIKFLINLGIKRIYIAGMDGYTPNTDENYANQERNFFTGEDIAKKKNARIISVLKQYREQVILEFITTPKFITLE